MIVVGVILYATLNPDPVGAREFNLFANADKLIHAIMFGGLFSALCFDWRRDGRILTRRRILAFAAATVIAGACDETFQYLLRNGREGDILDFCADTFGVFVAYFTAPPVIQHIFKNKCP